MAKVYLKGEDVEITEARRLARLLSISHECYEDYCIIGLSNSNYNNRQTKYCFGVITHPTSGEYALEIDDTQNEYNYLASVHVDRLVSEVDMDEDGWFDVEEP